MNRIISELKEIIAKNKDFKFQFRYTNWETDFLRFYRSQVNYDISKRNTSLSGTVVKDKKKFSFSLSNPKLEEIDGAVEEAMEMVEKLPEDPDFSDFEDNMETYSYKDEELVNNIAKVPVEEKIEVLKKIDAEALKNNFKIFGTFITLLINSRLINSNGLDKVIFESPIMLDVKAVADSNMVTVIDSYGGNDFSKFNLENFIQRLSAKIEYAKKPVIDVEPGEYEAILGPHAVKELLQYLFYGAYAGALDRKNSFFEGKVDKKIFPDFFNVSSLPFHPEVIRIPYNGDGHLAKDLEVIKNGVFKNFFVDNYYGKKLKMEKNGSVGVEALVLHEGNKSIDEMIKGVKKGLYISNLHYMNFINQKETSVTGLTRDGTFLIEDGKITKTVNNLRYTEKISEIFENAVEIENYLYSMPTSDNYGPFEITSSLVPHVKTSKFKISSSTHTI